MGWYTDVSNDISKIPDAISYYENEYKLVRQELFISGSLEKQAAGLPGIVEYRYFQLQEIEAILNFLNIQLRKTRSKYFKKYLENYQRSLSSRDVEKYVDGESDVVDYELLINEFALLRNKWLGVFKALDQKGFSINNIIKLRTAGLDDATI